MDKKKFAEVKIKTDLRVCFYPECGHVVIFDSKNNVVESSNCKDLEFVEVSFYEEIEDEKR